MTTRTVLVCDRGHDALRLVHVAGEDLCPLHALATLGDTIRTGEVEEIEIRRRERPAGVVRMRRAR